MVCRVGLQPTFLQGNLVVNDKKVIKKRPCTFIVQGFFFVFNGFDDAFEGMSAVYGVPWGDMFSLRNLLRVPR